MAEVVDALGESAGLVGESAETELVAFSSRFELIAARSLADRRARAQKKPETAAVVTTRTRSTRKEADLASRFFTKSTCEIPMAIVGEVRSLRKTNLRLRGDDDAR